MKQIKEFLFESKNKSELIKKIVLILVAPYAYLILCGILFDKLLKWYFMTNFIFFSLIALYVAAFVTVAVMIKKYRKQ